MVTIIRMLLDVELCFVAALHELGDKENMAEEQIWTEEEMDPEGRVFEIKKKVYGFAWPRAFYR